MCTCLVFQCILCFVNVTIEVTMGWTYLCKVIQRLAEYYEFEHRFQFINSV